MARPATGIDIGSHAIKFVQLRRKPDGTLRMVNAGRMPLGEQGIEEDSKLKAGNLSVLLRNLLDSRNADVTAATMAVTGRKVIVRYAHVPPVPVWRLKKLMQYEIEEEAGVDNTDNLASDFHLLDLPNKASEFTVMVGLAKNEPVQFQMDVVEGAGIKVDDITLTALSTFNTFKYSFRNRPKEEHDTCAIVNIGAENMDMAIERDGHLFFARNLTPGGRAFTEALQQELRIPFENAERLKVQRGRMRITQEQPPPPAEKPKRRPPDGSIRVLNVDGSIEDEDAAVGLDVGPEDTPVDIAIDTDSIPVLEVGESSMDEQPADEKGRDDDIPVLRLEGNPDDEDTALGYEDDASRAQRQPDGSAEPQDPVSLALEAAAHSILVSLQSSLMYCRAQTRIADLKVDRLYLTGGAADLPGLAEYLSSRLKMPVEVFDPLAEIDLSPLDEQTRAEVKRDRGCYSVAIGLAMQHFDDTCVRMSLLPAPVKAKRHFMEHGFYGYAACVSYAVAICLVAFSSIYFTGEIKSYLRDQKRKQNVANSAKQKREALEAENKQLAAEVAYTKRKLQQGRQFITAFAVIKKTVPKEIRVTAIQTFDGNNPDYHTISEEGKFGTKAQSVKPPPDPFILLSGIVDDSLKPEEKRSLVIAWADTFAKQKGLRGEAVFSDAKIMRHVADGGKLGFDLRIPLIVHQMDKVRAIEQK